MPPDDAGTEWLDRPGGEPVELREPSPQWAVVAAEWGTAIRGALAPLAPRVEHVGSTAVPGLVAKPVLDLQVSVPDVEDEPAYRPGLESLGLVLRAREPGHRFFRPPAGRPRVVHVHVCGVGSGWEREHLLFRDHLRAHPDAAAAYAGLERDLARAVGHDRLAYTEGKTGFVRRAVEAAGRADLPGGGRPGARLREVGTRRQRPGPGPGGRPAGLGGGPHPGAPGPRAGRRRDRRVAPHRGPARRRRGRRPVAGRPGRLTRAAG